MTEKQFFQEVANLSGYLDADLVKRVYNGMIDVLYRELREKGAIRFPQLCDFHFVRVPEKMVVNHKMFAPIIVPTHHVLHIRPMYTVKRYFKAYDQSHPDAVLDPQERMKKEGIEFDVRRRGLSR